MPYKLVQLTGLFTPTPPLKAHLNKYLLEYGAAGRTHLQWGDWVTVWRIENDISQECGYAWCYPRTSDPTARDINIAVFDSYAWNGAGSVALQHIEQYAVSSGVTALYGQVNSNLPNTGIKVRLWLARCGFSLFNRNTAPYWPQLTDEEYLRKHANPVYLRKIIQPTVPAQAETPQKPQGEEEREGDLLV